MPPDPNDGQVPRSDTCSTERGDMSVNTSTSETTADTQIITEEYKQTAMLAPRKQRERRLMSPTATLALLETLAVPLSPASSASTSLGISSADSTFEPSIDMMVNDFDDEQTLNEEEALAALEHQDPHDEISTLKEESEMPLEELLAKYCAAPPPNWFSNELPRKKAKHTAGGSKHSKQKKFTVESATSSAIGLADQAQTVNENAQANDLTNDVIVIESGDEEVVSTELLLSAQKANHVKGVGDVSHTSTTDANDVYADDRKVPTKQQEQPHRSHLLDLYPEQSFGIQESKVPLPMYEEDEDANDMDDDEIDSDFVKKTIMVGHAYQAVIPDGLSQYGDVLPYENEDKLIWEPSQVSERQVEEYLVKARDIKPSLLDNDGEPGGIVQRNDIIKRDVANPGALNGNKGDIVESMDAAPTSAIDERRTTAPVLANENETSGVIKDNEQALHLLVQCGYDFKEALRRKRLNALPLSGSMSLWSEEECKKFEEGIQKYGKDFLKIRQNQVRTRTMPELVQFYYLWKKSDRRDHNFANSDTVDHMDIYLNEGSDFSPNAASGATGTSHSAGNNTSNTPPLNARKNQKNFSIMMTGSNTNSVAAPTSPHSNGVNSKVTSNRKQRSGALAGCAGSTGTVNNCNESSMPQSIT